MQTILEYTEIRNRQTYEIVSNLFKSTNKFLSIEAISDHLKIMQNSVRYAIKILLEMRLIDEKFDKIEKSTLYFSLDNKV